ncbi:MAG: thioesterase [Acidobacteriales bacterium]|nr:thioesterase [Terriglobales bacterium]
MRLVCFPFAGSSASIFRPWIDRLPAEVEVLGVQLPGRENRLREQYIRNMDEIVEHLEREIGPALDPPYVFFGHSLGSLIAYELLQRLEATGRGRAELFVASGAPAPHTCISSGEPLTLTKEQIQRDLRKISGTDTTLLDNVELIALLLPMFQADFELYVNYRYRDAAPIKTPIVVIRGADDIYISHQRQLEWNRHTHGQFLFHIVPGGHHFMIDSSEAVLGLINNYLKPILSRHIGCGLPIVQDA